ncbi:Fic family protein [uncultured Thiohalocapsa sp.]|uniref:Fic family protein n=1 Tax=uncultured Thiohalocapsa sp. TaxID=768990 RepID=UPI0025F0B79E|nr:Fic family protein [uncultured Thiohalocapsa sp.]
MAHLSEKLAESLQALEALQRTGTIAVRSADLSRPHRERLLRGGFLQEVIKGWYIPARPDEPAGSSTAWYASYWDFCAAYLNARFGDAWCLSPEQSVRLHAGNRTVPRQLLVRTDKGGNKLTQLPHATALLDVRSSLPKPSERIERAGLRLYSLAAALVFSGPGLYRQHPIDAQAALAMLQDPSELLHPLLEGGHTSIAGRLIGALRNMGRTEMAEEILSTLRTAGYQVRVQDPFETPTPAVLTPQPVSPDVHRLRLMWQQMRQPVMARFPDPPGLPTSATGYLAEVDDLYVTDAYHSLSIEGYRVSADLIERVRRGDWNPQTDADDRAQRDALAARGYWQAFQALHGSLERVLAGETAGRVAEQDHRLWYRELFAPGITAGLLRPTDLAGYRNAQVYIRQSMHVPPPREAVRDMMPALFDCLTQEDHPAVRAVLGHFLFVYIHPYMDGNGRMGRFLMNLMLASGGYPWTVVPVEQRHAYMGALEQASVEQDIVPLADLLLSLIKGSKTKQAQRSETGSHRDVDASSRR